MVIFHGYVSLPEGRYIRHSIHTEHKDVTCDAQVARWFAGGCRRRVLAGGRATPKESIIIQDGDPKIAKVPYKWLKYGLC